MSFERTRRSGGTMAPPRWLAKTLTVVFLAAGWASAAAQPIAIGGDAARGGHLARRMCAGCHGADGNSTDPYFPKLAGQGAFYLYEQLRMFKQFGHLRGGVGVMAAMATDLEAAQMRDLAAWFSSQTPKLPAIVATQVQRPVDERGQRIYLRGLPEQKIAACASCHAVSGAGLPPEYPRLAGQHPQYLERQLRAFRSGERANNPNQLMRDVAHDMADRDINAVSSYIGQMR